MMTTINIGESLATRAFLNPGKEAMYDVAAQQRFTFTECLFTRNCFANRSVLIISIVNLPPDK